MTSSTFTSVSFLHLPPHHHHHHRDRHRNFSLLAIDSLSHHLPNLFFLATAVNSLTSPRLSLPHRHRHHPDHHHRHHNFSLLATSSTTPPPSTTTAATTTTTGTAIIIGGGLSGLAAATHLHSKNIPFLLLESSDDIGGRVRTDTTADGFLLDRGFQIFITAYPEPQKLLNYKTLNLQKFYSGAKIFFAGKFYNVADPIRHFRDSIVSLTNPIGTIFDKLLIGITRIRVLLKSDEEIFSSDEVKVIDLLKREGFSDLIIDRFFRPFFGGIFFDFELETTSRLFDFIFKCLALGDNTLPEKGIGEIPKQLASKLPKDSIRLNSRVLEIEIDEKIGGNSVIVRLENGEELRSEIGVILAVEEPEVERLLAGSKFVGDDNAKRIRKPGRSTVCLYFSMDRDLVPSSDPVLYLNGSGKGIVNNMFFATNVVPSYGPPDKALVSVSLIGLFDDVSDDELAARVVKELSEWFGESVVGSWKHLRTYRVKFAQPNQSPPTDLMKSPRFGSGLYLCGDYQTSATFDGALVSGRRAVEALLEDRALSRVSKASN